MALIEKSCRKQKGEPRALWSPSGSWAALRCFNAIHIQMRVTNFGTETNALPPPGPGVRKKKKKKTPNKNRRPAFCEPDTCAGARACLSVCALTKTSTLKIK